MIRFWRCLDSCDFVCTPKQEAKVAGGMLLQDITADHERLCRVRERRIEICDLKKEGAVEGVGIKDGGV